ncbi:MAG: hypothetical protein HN350_08980 [Phycisphaerales bacterium]|jgi:hypothetical protein|nr:hypothetical protein [Phycisphaerales bacterium]
MIQNRKLSRIRFAAATVLLACVISACVLAAPKKKAPAKKARPKPPATSVLVTPSGLKPDSPRQYKVFKGSRCVSIARVGSPQGLAPGQYDVQVGFPSGRVSRPINLKSGQKIVVPTGLFGFRKIAESPNGSTIPQKLYQGDKYLASGYHGMTARLLPGKYTVRYHLPGDVNPSQLLRKWYVAGTFPLDWRKDLKLLKEFPAERPGKFNAADKFTLWKKNYAWVPVEGRSIDLRKHAKKVSGAIYMAREVFAKTAGRAELVLSFRGGMVVWLNGKKIKTISQDKRFTTHRISTFVTLKKGRNELLLKTFAATWLNGPVSASLERWRTYDVNIVARANRYNQAPVIGARTASPGAIPGVEGIVFSKVPNLTNGRSGLHYEQFRIVTRPYKAAICTLIPACPEGKLTDLTSGKFAVAIQPDISYDARRVIFSAKRTNARTEKWNVYDMNLDGTGLRQITRGIGDCMDPCYLPDGQILFGCNKPGFRDEYDRDKALLLHTCKPDGSELQQITFNLSSDTASIVMNDGRILFTSWQHHAEHVATNGVFAFCTLMPDGTGFMPFYGNHNGQGNNTKSYAQQLTDGRVVYVDSAGHRHYNGGGLSTIDPRKPMSSRVILTPGMIYNGHNLAGRYASPYPLPDGGMICSYSPGRGTYPLRDDPAETIHMGVYHFDFASGRPGRIIYDDPKTQDYDAIAIYRRTTPPALQPMTIPGRKTGSFFCVNAYLSDRKKQSKRVVVGELPPAEPGEIKRVRVLEGFGVEDMNPKKHKGMVIDILQMSFGSSSNSGNAFEQRSIIGYAPVEKDGSFHIEVPADTVMCLQTLDKNDMAIETQLTWVWVRPGETRTCIGCHEDRETALANTDCMAMRKKAYFVAPPKEKRRTVDFRRDIMPIIEKRCSSCHHGGKDTDGGLDLRKGFDLVFHRSGCRGRTINAAIFNHAYESLLQAPTGRTRVGTLVISGAAKYSPLIWRLYGKQLGFTDERNPYTKKPAQMPPKQALSDAEKKLFVEWVDLGAQWDNIPGEDKLPGYDQDQSRAMSIAAAKLVAKPITTGKAAFDTRCLECHDASKLAKWKKANYPDPRAMIARMSAKRKGWIHQSEVPLILRHVQNVLSVKK